MLVGSSGGELGDVDWEVLRGTTIKGVYCQGLSLYIHDSKLVAWLVEAILYTRPNR